ncbi:3,4-dihydroxy-2-butanone-4-phosphate synthase [Aquisediminimonas profunda]|uniref:3,4-dihydroxy-2-butanone-4-phosphate synthase n=1 Tax=Aquisediminimonas profunda TaxID=1550733 RepID=UPI001C62A07F|nr:3,4-dihydroxy-2-butanone-4-phosphate synthase [Aquisediminimonas profunda]
MGGMLRGASNGPLTVLIEKSALDGRGRGLLFQDATRISADHVNFMARYGRGLIGAAMTPERAYGLGLAPMNDNRTNADAPRYLASVEAKACTETGISASERALTLRTLAEPTAVGEDLVSPGHIMPAIVPNRTSKDSRLEALAFHHASRFNDALAIAWCDILDEQGNVASWTYCEALAQAHALPLLVRMGEAAVDALALANSALEPSISVGAGGLDREQFA